SRRSKTRPAHARRSEESAGRPRRTLRKNVSRETSASGPGKHESAERPYGSKNRPAKSATWPLPLSVHLRPCGTVFMRERPGITLSAPSFRTLREGSATTAAVACLARPVRGREFGLRSCKKTALPRDRRVGFVREPKRQVAMQELPEEFDIV